MTGIRKCQMLRGLKVKGRINLKNMDVVDKGGIFDKNRDASLFIWEK